MVAQTAGRDLWVTWPEYHGLIEQLALQVHRSGFEFEQILCLARGGMRVGDVLSRLFRVPLAILATSSYRAAEGTEQGALNIAQYVTSTAGTLTGKVLLVDDLVDSGVTFSAVYAHLLRSYPAVTQIKTAVLWQKAHSVIQPDFVVSVLKDNPGIHQPFENYDSLTFDQLTEKWAPVPNK